MIIEIKYASVNASRQSRPIVCQSLTRRPLAAYGSNRLAHGAPGWRGARLSSSRDAPSTHCHTAIAFKLTVSKTPHPTPTLDHIEGHSLRAIFMSKIRRQLRFRDRGHLNIAPWMYCVGHHRDQGDYLSVAL